MLIEQIIEFELRGLGPPHRTCTQTTGYFHDKTKICKKNLPVDHYFLLNIPHFPLPGPIHLQNLTPKCKILVVFWTN